MSVPLSPSLWRQVSSRWWMLLALAGVFVVTTGIYEAITGTAVARLLVAVTFGFVAILCGFVAGQQKAEHDRLNRRDPLAKHRPPGV
jgi:hypothetical protein